MKVRPLLTTVVLLVASACGPTVGDPCTTEAECLGKACINGGSTPGGYCSVVCTMDGSTACPTGSVCISNALGNGVHGCMRVCNSSRDCRRSRFPAAPACFACHP